MNWAISSTAPTLLISDTGRIVRMASSRQRGKNWQYFPEKELHPRLTGAGYLSIQYKLQGNKFTQYVHRLVAEAFLEHDEYANEVNHVDGNKTNNYLSNLEWVSHSKNHRHAAKHGLSSVVVLKANQVKAIKKQLKDRISVQQLAFQYKISESAVKHIKYGHTWSWLE